MKTRVFVILGLLLATLAVSIPAARAEVPSDDISTQQVRSVCANDLTIWNSYGGGAKLGTLYWGDRFSVEWNDGVWALGTGYRLGSGYYVARGWVLAQYLC
jgi:hypothetical protein